MGVGFVKLSSDCFCGNGLQDEYQVLLSPLLQYCYDLQKQSSSIYVIHFIYFWFSTTLPLR